MGWLRELMRGATPPYRSYGALARDALSHRKWPEHTRPQARSLAAIFSKLDRDLECEWLAERDEVQRVLADLLACPVSDIHRSSGARDATAGAPSRRIRLDDLRHTRSLDLLEESLCPGFPLRVLEPGRWRRLWWRAESGSGRSLAGRWLQARGLARYVAASSLNEARTALLAAGPAFVELHGGDASAAPPDGTALCIAAPFVPHPSWGFEVVESPPVGQYLDDLVEWVNERVAADGQFDPEFTRHWLRSGPAADHGLVDGLGSALGLCGLVDELGARALRRASLTEATRRFFDHRIAEAAERAEAAWLRRSGFDVLVGLFTRILTDSDEPWTRARTFDEWLDLVPAEHRRGADVEWMRLTLLDGETVVRPADIDRAARVLPPGAFRVVRSLQHASLLTPDPDGTRLVLRPRWFGNSLAAAARRALVDGSPFEWGEALLRPHAAPAIERLLQERVAEGDATSVDQVLELGSDDSPALVAALETAFRCVGLSLLDGSELPTELLEAIFNEQIRLMFELPGCVPEPRIPAPDPAARVELHAAWLASALAISEQLPGGVGLEHPSLRPWDAPAAPAGLDAVFDVMLRAVDKASPAWGDGVFSLVDRLRSAIGSVRPTGWHPLELPGAILDEVEHGVLAWETVRGLEGSRIATVALRRLAHARGAAWEQVAKAVWEAWLSAGAPSEGLRELDPLTDQGEHWFGEVPPSALSAWLSAASAEAIAHACRRFADPQWEVLVQRLPTLGSEVRNHPALWRAMVDVRVSAALEIAGSVESAVLSELWMRCPQELGALLAQRLAAGRPADGLALVLATPASATATVLSQLEPRLRDAPPDVLEAVRGWLHERVAHREPDWVACYALLARLERESPRGGD